MSATTTPKEKADASEGEAKYEFNQWVSIPERGVGVGRIVSRSRKAPWTYGVVENAKPSERGRKHEQVPEVEIEPV